MATRLFHLNSLLEGSVAQISLQNKTTCWNKKTLIIFNKVKKGFCWANCLVKSLVRPLSDHRIPRIFFKWIVFCNCLSSQLHKKKHFSNWSMLKNCEEAQWPIGYGIGLRIKRSWVRIRPWPLRWVLGQGSLLPLSQGEAFTLDSISYLAILVKYILAKKKKKNWNTAVVHC